MIRLFLLGAISLGAATSSLRLNPPAHWIERPSPAKSLIRVFTREGRNGNVNLTYTDSDAPGSKTLKDFETYVHAQYVPSASSRLSHQIVVSREVPCGKEKCFSALAFYRNDRISRFAGFLSFTRDGKSYLGLFAVPSGEKAEALSRKVLAEMESAL